MGTLIAFGTAAIYVSFLMTALAALIARVRGSWEPAGLVRLGRWGLVINVLAVGWLAFETVNIAWPRESLAPLDAPFYQVWAAPLLLALIAAVGGAYLLLARPQRALPPSRDPQVARIAVVEPVRSAPLRELSARRRGGAERIASARDCAYSSIGWG